ncbi:uncharacterized protein LOC125673880 [Ostrea edulis]|uniref:uncharacterized protein LOC125673880 n=1 Tax=Ostrea edulis TaxID=37623 RepID=UPI0024AF75C5|nr:uncharacterized protein LOC125673880 [Ostrea edulis]
MPFSQFALISWILINVSSAHSPLADPKLESCPSICLNESSHQEIGNLKQLLNQESLIRLSLMKQVYSLVGDMIAIKQRIAGVFVEGRQFEDKLEAMEKTIESLGNENQKLRTELEQKNIIGVNATDFMTETRDLLHANNSNAEEQGIVFNAFLSKTLHFERNTPINVTYDVTTYNTNNVYSPRTGVFTAPSDGVYVFSWASVVIPGKIFNAELLVNNERKGKGNCDNEAGSSYENCSNTVPVILKNGDRVNIRTTTANNLIGNEWSSFKGWKIR